MGSMLFNTSAQDPLTLATITILLGVVALVALGLSQLRGNLMKSHRIVNRASW
jgi:hypothetical protein